MKADSWRVPRPAGCLAAAVLLSSLPVQAALPELEENPSPQAFALRFSRVRTPLGGTDDPSLVGSAGLSWQQVAASYLQVGVLAGYTAVTQTGRPLTAGMRLEGYHAGLVVRGLAWPRPFLQVLIETRYVYYHVKDTLAGQNVALDWQETEIAGGGIWYPLDSLRLFGSLHYGALDRQERAYGTMNHTLDFNTNKGGGAVGLEFSVDPSGDIGVQRSWGLHDGFTIYFQRRWP